MIQAARQLLNDPRIQRVRRSKYLHAFEFRGLRYGYLPNTGDLLELSEHSFDALTLHQDGVGVQGIRVAIRSRWGRARAHQVLADLRTMRDLGYLDAGPAGEKRSTDERISGLMEHHPRNLMLLVTEACNLRCTYCYETPNGVHDRAWTMKRGMAHHIIDKYFEDSGSRKQIAITFFGGEPLINFPLVQDVVEYSIGLARDQGKQVAFTMTTNLTLMTPEIADFLCEHHFSIMVSMDGGQEVQDAQRPTKSGEGSYEVVASNLRVLLAKQRECGVRPAKIRATLSYPASEKWSPIEIERQLLEFEPYEVSLGEDTSSAGTEGAGRQVQAGPGCTEERLPSVWEEHVHAYLDDLEQGRTGELSPSMVKSLQAIHKETARTNLDFGQTSQLCGTCRNMKAVTANGDYFPCHRYVGMEQYKIGNVREGVDQERVGTYYRSIFESYAAKCQHCWARVVCGGECAWKMATDDGGITLPDEDLCQERRFGLELQLGMFGYMLTRFPGVLTKLIRGPSGRAVDGGDPVR